MPPVVTMNPFMVPSSPFVQTNATTTPQPSARFTAAAVIPTAHFHHQQQQQQQQGYFMEARVPMFIPAQQQQQPLNGVFMGQPQQGMFLVPRDGQQQQQHGGFVLAGHESGGCFVLAPPPYGGAVMMAMPTQQMPTMQPFFMQPSNNNTGSPFMEFSPNDTQFVHPAVMQVPEPMSSAPMRTPAHGRALGATCMWIPLTDEPRHVQRTGNPRHCEKLFIGQARHETTTAHIVLMLEALCGVIPAVLRPAGKGCFILFVSSMEDCHRVTTLHRRVLFDHNGVWFAANDAGLATLSAYVQSPSFHRACRRQLPVQCMVAEYQPDTIEPGWKSAAAAVNSGFDTPVPSSAQSTSTDTPPLADE